MGVEELPADEVEPEEFVRAWVEAFAAGALSGDTTEMRALSSGECFTCNSFASSIEDVYAAGGRIEADGAYAVLTSTEERESENSTTAEVVANIHLGPGQSWESAGADPVDFESDNEWSFFLIMEEGSWRVRDIGVDHLPADEVQPEELVRAFVDAYGAAISSGDTSRLQELSLESCEVCADVIEELDDIWGAGGKTEFGQVPLVVQGQVATSPDDADDTVVTFEARRSAGTTTMASGADPISVPAVTETWILQLVVTDNRWRIKDWLVE
ncbi:DUF6318 family protein [Nocardioides sp. AE5]|uniref:DUF6318 family protein n=1 Tax=Nocardioides sp. AE5 TaxID=2962573 RepID=UPI002882527C|nr:DUF6318 family protein [Nocardioides sp. AE5]MDT0201325.1 DUF6318 family protein [Nocardioides sp. AE5]